jgi:ATP:corrinoid adenosyltransferase
MTYFFKVEYYLDPSLHTFCLVMKERERRQGVVLVHTGEGKGKSSSAFGMVFERQVGE